MARGYADLCEVVDRRLETDRIVLEVTQSSIAGATEKTADLAALVTVVDGGSAHLVAADSAEAILLHEERGELLLAEVVLLHPGDPSPAGLAGDVQAVRFRCVAMEGARWLHPLALFAQFLLRRHHREFP